MWNSDYRSKQGNIGLGRAIAYFTTKGLMIALPLNDTQKYDVIVELDSVLKRVSVKTSAFKKNGNYVIQLKNSGGGSNGSIIRNFDNSTCDLVFVLCDDNSMYLIPSCDIDAISAYTLTPERCEKYKVDF